MEKVDLSEKEKTKIYKHIASNYLGILLGIAGTLTLIAVVSAGIYTWNLIFGSEAYEVVFTIPLGGQEFDINIYSVFGAFIGLTLLIYFILKRIKIKRLDSEALIYITTGEIHIDRRWRGRSLHYDPTFVFRDNNDKRHIEKYTCLEDAKEKMNPFDENLRFNIAKNVEAFVVTTGEFTRAVPTSVIGKLNLE